LNLADGKKGEFKEDKSQIRLVALTSTGQEITIAKVDYDIGKLANDFMDTKVKLI
jgi:hypothetical protein